MTEGGNLTDTREALGIVDVSPEAIAMVAGIAALECFGVVGMASQSFQDGIAELFRGRDNLAKGIKVLIDEEQVVIQLYVIVEYGIRIREVAKNVIENVRYAVENQLGLAVAYINVIVQGVQMGVKG